MRGSGKSLDLCWFVSRNSGGEEESDVFGNGVWEVVFWICGWEEGKESLKGMVESWTDEAISNVGKSNFVEVSVMFDWAMFWGAHATIGDSDRDVDGCWRAQKRSPGFISNTIEDVSTVTDIKGVRVSVMVFWEFGLEAAWRLTVLSSIKPFLWVSEPRGWTETVREAEHVSGTIKHSSEQKGVRKGSGSALGTETHAWMLVLWLPTCAAIRSEIKKGFSSTCEDKPTHYHTTDMWTKEHEQRKQTRQYDSPV